MSEKHILLATSSPRVGGGAYTDVIFARDSDGTKLMNSVILGEPCPMCRATATPESCTHKQDELASWKDPKKMARLEKIYRAVGAEEIYRGELRTMTRETVSALFGRELYEDLLCVRPQPSDRQRLAEDDRVSAVYVAIDPAGGGKSEFALTAIGHVASRNQFQVLLLCAEALSTPRSEQDQVQAMVDGMMMSLRKHPRVGPGVPVVVAIEGCNADPMYLAKMLIGPSSPHADVLIMTELSGGKRYGVPKTEQTTKRMVMTIQTMLSLGLISIASDAVALSTRFAARHKTMRDYKETLSIQFGSFRISPKTGKMSGKEFGGNDDLLITLMMACYWMTQFVVNMKEDYAEFRMQYDPEIWRGSQPAELIARKDRLSADPNSVH